MNYSECRSYIKTGDVVAFSHADWTSWSGLESQVVKLATQSKFTHVGIVWRAGERLFVIESVVPEIRIFPLSNFNEFYLLQIPKTLSKEAEDYAISLVGQKYSKIEAIKGYFGINEVDKKWQCAEFVLAVLNHDKRVIACKATPRDVVTGSLEQLGCRLQLINNRRV